MALAWIDNELFLNYKGVTTFRLYKGDMHNNPFSFQFSYFPTAAEDDDYAFDVRNLAEYVNSGCPNDDEEIKGSCNSPLITG